MKQQPGQDVASFAVDVLKAARGLEMTQAQLVRLVLGGLHAKVTPFVEMSQPQTVEELLCCPAAAKGMTAPAMERDVMAYTTHSIEVTGHGSDRVEQVTTRDAPGRATRTTAVRRISGLRGRSSGTGGATRHRPRRGLRVGPPRPAAIYPGGARLLRSGLEVGCANDTGPRTGPQLP